MGREKNYEQVSPTIIFTQYYHYEYYQASPLSKYGFQLSFVGVNLRLLREEILSSNIIIQQINSNYSWSALIWGNRRGGGKSLTKIILDFPSFLRPRQWSPSRSESSIWRRRQLPAAVRARSWELWLRKAIWKPNHHGPPDTVSIIFIIIDFIKVFVGWTLSCFLWFTSRLLNLAKSKQQFIGDSLR